MKHFFKNLYEKYFVWVFDRSVNVYMRAASLLFVTALGIASMTAPVGFVVWLVLKLPEVVGITICVLIVVGILVKLLGVVIQNIESH